MGATDRTQDLVGAYQHGVQNVYRDGSTTALLRLSLGLFAKRIWHWSTDPLACSEAAPATVSDGVDGLLRAATIAHGSAPLGELIAWSEDDDEQFRIRPGLVLGNIFNKTLLREGLRTFEMMRLASDVSMLVRIVDHNGPCLVVSHGVDAIFVMGLSYGDTPGKPAPVKVVSP